MASLPVAVCSWLLIALIVIPLAANRLIPLAATLRLQLIYFVAVGLVTLTFALAAPSRRAGIVSALVLIPVMACLLGCLFAFGWAFGHFSVQSDEATVRQPAGSLLASVHTVDDGALGASQYVLVQGDAVPGYLRWRWRVLFVDPPDMNVTPLAWSGQDHVLVAGKSHALPLLMRWVHAGR